MVVDEVFAEVCRILVRLLPHCQYLTCGSVLRMVLWWLEMTDDPSIGGGAGAVMRTTPSASLSWGTRLSTARSCALVLSALVGDTSPMPYVIVMSEVKTHLINASKRRVELCGGTMPLRYEAAFKFTHWALEPFLQKVESVRLRLANLLTLTGCYERARIPGRYNSKALAMQTKVAIEHQAIDSENTALRPGEMWQRAVRTLTHMYRDNAPMDFFPLVVDSNCDMWQRSSSSPSEVDNRDASTLMLEAAVARVIELVSLPEPPPPALVQVKSTGNDLEINRVDPRMRTYYAIHWGLWESFALLFFSFVDSGAIDFGRFVCALSDARMPDGAPIKHNAIVWLLSQCLPLDRIKRSFVVDLQEKRGRLFTALLAFYNPTQMLPQHTFALRDTAMFCSIYRVRVADSNTTRNYQFILNSMIPPCLIRSSSGLEEPRRWWQGNCVDGEIVLDYDQLGSRMISVSLLSNFSSQPIATHMRQFLLKPPVPELCSQLLVQILADVNGYLTSHGHNFRPNIDTTKAIECVLPHQIAFIGKWRPHDMVVLSSLSLRSKQRLLSLIEVELETLARQPNTAQITVEPPGSVETYARLMYISHSRHRFKLHRVLRSATPVALHTLLEVVSHRLMRLVHINSDSKYVFGDLYQRVGTVTDHRLYHTMVNLLLKVCSNTHRLILLTGSDSVLGHTISRALVLSAGRVLRVYGVPDLMQTDTLTSSIQRFYDDSDRHIWSDQTLGFLPSKFYSFYSNRLNEDRSGVQAGAASNGGKVPHPRVWHTSQLVAEEYRQFAGLLENPSQWYSYYNAHPAKCGMIYCMIWHLMVDTVARRGVNATQASLQEKEVMTLRHIIHHLPPRDVESFVYEFVDYLVDESALQTIPLSRVSSNDAGTGGSDDPYLIRRHKLFTRTRATADTIQLYGACLATLVWVHDLIDFQPLVMALVDRSDDPNAIAIVEYLLLHDKHFSDRVDFYLSLGIDPRHWQETDSFAKHQLYHRQFPPHAIPTDKTVLPLYFSAPPTDFLPVCDFVIRRLVEISTTVPHASASTTSTSTSSSFGATPTSFPFDGDGACIGGATSGGGSSEVLDAVDAAASKGVALPVESLARNTSSNLLDRVVVRYANLYRYHATPTSFVSNLIHYYFRAHALLDTRRKVLMFRLLNTSELPFSPAFCLYIRSYGIVTNSRCEANFTSYQQSCLSAECYQRNTEAVAEASFKFGPYPAPPPPASSLTERTAARSTLCQAQYIRSRIADVARSIDTQTPGTFPFVSAVEDPSFPSDGMPHFMELPCRSQRVLAAVVLELFVLPMSSDDITSSIFDELLPRTSEQLAALSRGSITPHYTFADINAASLVLSSLPTQFHSRFYNIVAEILNPALQSVGGGGGAGDNDDGGGDDMVTGDGDDSTTTPSTFPLLSSIFVAKKTVHGESGDVVDAMRVDTDIGDHAGATDGGRGARKGEKDGERKGANAEIGDWFSQYVFVDFTSAHVSTMDNVANRLLHLLHQFFHHSSIENLSVFPGFVQKCCSPLTSVLTMFFLCRAIAPFMYRLSCTSTTDLIGNVVLTLFSCFVDLNDEIKCLYEHKMKALGHHPSLVGGGHTYVVSPSSFIRGPICVSSIPDKELMNSCAPLTQRARNSSSSSSSSSDDDDNSTSSCSSSNNSENNTNKSTSSSSSSSINSTASEFPRLSAPEAAALHPYRSLELVDVLIDFFFHCRRVFRLHRQIVFEMKNIVKTLHDPLRTKLKVL